MDKPSKITMAKVKQQFGIDVPAVVAGLQKTRMGALIVSATGEAMLIDWLRAVMPTKPGLIVGVITDPPKPTPILVGKEAHQAIADARRMAIQFSDRPTTETRRALVDALTKLETTL
jgi:hypothetical protein